VLFVCTANICRSPYMELRARTLIANAPDAPLIEFASAGTHGFRDHPADPTMAEVMAARGVPKKQIDAFTSRRLSRKLVETADLVLTAEGTHRAYVLEEVPASFRKVFTLGQFAESITRVDPSLSGAQLLAAVGHRRAGTAATHDVADPFNRGLPAAEEAADQIDSLLRVVLPQLTGSERIVP
jgi:sulfate adenylyltransferase